MEKKPEIKHFTFICAISIFGFFLFLIPITEKKSPDYRNSTENFISNRKKNSFQYHQNNVKYHWIDLKISINQICDDY